MTRRPDIGWTWKAAVAPVVAFGLVVLATVLITPYLGIYALFLAPAWGLYLFVGAIVALMRGGLPGAGYFLLGGLVVAGAAMLLLFGLCVAVLEAQGW